MITAAMVSENDSTKNLFANASHLLTYSLHFSVTYFVGFAEVGLGGWLAGDTLA